MNSFSFYDALIFQNDFQKKWEKNKWDGRLLRTEEYGWNSLSNKTKLVLQVSATYDAECIDPEHFSVFVKSS